MLVIRLHDIADGVFLIVVNDLLDDFFCLALSASFHCIGLMQMAVVYV